MKTYSKKASKRTERAERSSSDDDRVGKEQPDPLVKTPKRTRSSSKDDESDEKSRKICRTNKNKLTQKTASQKRKLGKR